MSLLLKRIVVPLAEFTLSLDLELPNRVTAIFGPSGAGKTALLEVVAGLRRAQSAFIQLDDRVLVDAANRVFVPARARGIGYVPQDLALFPHFSVRRNLLYGHRASTAEPRLFSFEHIVKVLDLEPLIGRGILDLSGGEKQRVALARALLTSPRLLLLDEPLASLDLPLKSRILPYLARIRDEFRLPMLYVTHDAGEVEALCEDAVLFERGRVIQGPIGVKQFVQISNAKFRMPN